MPSAIDLRFCVTRCGTIRSSLATTAATGGVLLGGFVAVQLLATPKYRPILQWRSLRWKPRWRQSR